MNEGCVPHFTWSIWKPTRNADCVQVLLGYLPTDRSLWPSELAKKRSQYKQFKEELLVNPVSLHILHNLQVVNISYCFCLRYIFCTWKTQYIYIHANSNLAFWWLVKLCITNTFIPLVVGYVLVVVVTFLHVWLGLLGHFMRKQTIFLKTTKPNHELVNSQVRLLLKRNRVDPSLS